MNVKPIRSKKDLREALARIDELMAAKSGAPEHDELEILSTLVEVYCISLLSKLAFGF